jgi:hypothetical protein
MEGKYQYVVAHEGKSNFPNKQKLRRLKKEKKRKEKKK